MKVTKVYFHEVSTSNSLLAFANVEFDGEITCKGFKIFNGKNGLFAKVPQEKNGDAWYDTIRFSDEKYYQEGNSETHPILTAIIDRWKSYKESSPSQGSGDSDGQPW